MYRTTVTVHNGHLETGGTEKTTETSIPTSVDTSNEYQQWLFYTQTSSASTNSLIKDIRQGTVISVSDGS